MTAALRVKLPNDVVTAPCFSNGAVMPSLDVRLSVRLSVCDVGDS